MLVSRKYRDRQIFLFLFKLLHFILLLFIFTSAVYIENGACIIPEASQEGSLRSFKSYEDVIMFHYSVPKQVPRATWQFAAFMNNKNCPHQTVNIFLKWGSYPVFSVNNASYPSQMYVEHNHTIQVSTTTKFQSKVTTIVPIYSPLPGDWFASAYLSQWDEKVLQKGLGLECYYSLGSVAIWSEINGIQNIPLGYQHTLKTAETITYYKIYIPMDTWFFQVDIWGCNFTVKTASHFLEPCIQNLALNARTLPVFNHSHPSSIGNITSMESYTFTEVSPFQDSWYYLMVVSKSAIKFYIKVTVFDCPVQKMDEIFINHYSSAPFYAGAMHQFHDKDLTGGSLQYYSFNQQYQKTLANTKESIISDEGNTCVPRYQLIRIKNVQTFSTDYLLQGKDWLTSWLALTDSYPVITQFDILPLIDIGGTLGININLAMNKILNEREVHVVICISRGYVPKIVAGHITCDNEHMTMRLSTTGVQNDSLLIPYPQPDTWYIALQTTCYVKRMPVHCEMKEILVSLNIKLHACVFEGNNSCGEYGTCQEIHKGVLYYTACKCFGGRQGWGCTDTSNYSSEVVNLLTTLFLILSNLFFVPAIYIAFKRKFYTEALIYFSSMLFSAFYHACDKQLTTYCIAKFEVLQYCDVFAGILAFWVTLVAMANVPTRYLSFCHMLGALIISIGVESDKTGLTSVLLPLVIGSFIPLCSYGYYCYKMKKIVWPKRIINLSAGLCLAGVGICLFSLVETESNYKYVHSLWHITIALSIVFLLPLPEDQFTNTTINILSSGKESPDDSDFIVENVHQDNHLIMDIK